MDYTTIYHLPQWVESDRVQMEDFNQMCADIDQGIKSAQDTASTAESKADAAQAAADAVQDAYKPDNKPYVTGTYTGTGAEQTITLGFRPSFLIISAMGQNKQSNSTVEWDRHYGITGGSALSRRLEFTDTGFIAHGQTYEHDFYPDFTAEGRVYDYIAFR